VRVYDRGGHRLGSADEHERNERRAAANQIVAAHSLLDNIKYVRMCVFIIMVGAAQESTGEHNREVVRRVAASQIVAADSLFYNVKYVRGPWLQNEANAFTCLCVCVCACVCVCV